MASIRVENVSRHFGKAMTALRSVTFEVRDREVVTVLGPSGCGKSTLLRIMAGLDFPSSGRILIDDEPVDSIPARDRNIAMVFQSYALYPHMTCYENLALNLRLKGLRTPEIDRRVRDTAAFLEITELLDKKPRQLSGGQRQRIALGRAVIRNPRVFLLDEPLSNLDAVLRERVRHELKELFKRINATVIYVTHDQIEAMTLADRVVVLNRGEVQQIAKPEDLYRFPGNRFVASFIGSPSMNIIEVQMVNGACTLGGVRLDTGLDISAPVAIGIRPEDIQLGAGSQATVSWLENLGAQFLVGVQLGNVSLTALTREAPISQSIEVRIDPAQVHVFEKESGRNLRCNVADGIANR
jgi:ABC-type sugar transport system ATPase subunit